MVMTLKHMCSMMSCEHGGRGAGGATRVKLEVFIGIAPRSPFRLCIPCAARLSD